MNEFVKHKSGLFLRFHKAGRTVFGSAWETARAGIVSAFTHKRESSSKRMYAREMTAACEHLEAIIASEDARAIPHPDDYNAPEPDHEESSVEDFIAG